MRRSDREVKDPAKITDIINSCSCCRIGFADNDDVYIVPLSFGYTSSGGTTTLYFHSAPEGRKIDLIRRAPKVGFEMDTNYELLRSSSACGHSARFQSIIGNGQVSIVEQPEEKLLGLKLIMSRTAGGDSWNFSEKMVDQVCVFKLQVLELSCKEHL